MRLQEATFYTPAESPLGDAGLNADGEILGITRLGFAAGLRATPHETHSEESSCEGSKPASIGRQPEAAEYRVQVCGVGRAEHGAYFWRRITEWNGGGSPVRVF